MRRLLALVLVVAPMAMADAQTLTFFDSPPMVLAPCGISSARVGGNTFLLAADPKKDRVSTYRVQDNGALVPAGNASLAPGSRPATAGFGWGRFAVVANRRSSDLYVFRMSPNGALTQVGQPVSAPGLNPANMVVAPTGLVAVTGKKSDQLATYWIDPRGGLHFLDKINTGLKPASIAIGGTRVAVTPATRNPAMLREAPTGLIAVTDSDTDELRTFWLDQHGRLTFVDRTKMGVRPGGIAVSSGNRIDVANPHAPDVSVYRQPRIVVTSSRSADVSVFRLTRLRNLQLESSTILAPRSSIPSFGAGNNLYLGTAPGQPGEPGRLYRFRLSRDGAPTPVSMMVNTGQSLSGLHDQYRKFADERLCLTGVSEEAPAAAPPAVASGDHAADKAKARADKEEDEPSPFRKRRFSVSVGPSAGILKYGELSESFRRTRMEALAAGSTVERVDSDDSGTSKGIAVRVMSAIGRSWSFAFEGAYQEVDDMRGSLSGMMPSGHDFLITAKADVAVKSVSVSAWRDIRPGSGLSVGVGYGYMEVDYESRSRNFIRDPASGMFTQFGSSRASETDGQDFAVFGVNYATGTRKQDGGKTAVGLELQGRYQRSLGGVGPSDEEVSQFYVAAKLRVSF